VPRVHYSAFALGQDTPAVDFSDYVAHAGPEIDVYVLSISHVLTDTGTALRACREAEPCSFQLSLNVVLPRVHSIRVQFHPLSVALQEMQSERDHYRRLGEMFFALAVVCALPLLGRC